MRSFDLKWWQVQLHPAAWAALPGSHTVLCVREVEAAFSWSVSDETGVEAAGTAATLEAAQRAAEEAYAR